MTHAVDISDPCDWKKAVVKDLTHHNTKKENVSRRHSVSVCRESAVIVPVSDKVSSSEVVGPEYQDGVRGENKEPATLDLNLKEISHIRSVLTKAQLEVSHVKYLSVTTEAQRKSRAKDTQILILITTTKWHKNINSSFIH